MLEGWKTDRVADLCERVSVGIVVKPSQYYVEDKKGVRAFRSLNVGEGKILDKDWAYISEEGHAKNGKSKLEEGDVLVVRTGAPGTACVLPLEYVGSNCIDIVFARPNQKKMLPEYLAALTNSAVGRRHVIGNTSGLAQKHFNVGAYKELIIDYPPLPEQHKIAEILRTWDEALEKLTALRAAKERQASAIRLSIFEAEYSSHNRLVRARDLFEPVSERARPDLPLLAVMQDIGIVRRDDLDRRVAMPDGSTSSYKVVRPGDFVISLRSFEGGLEYSGITGLVSPAYTVLRPRGKIDGEYYRHFFKSRSFIGRLDKLIFGIRDGKQIAFRDFGDMLIPAPPLADQNTQSQAMVFLETEMALELKRFEALTQQKRGLMQKLLTGEWPVTLDEED